MEKARDFILKIFKYLNKPEMRILPGQLAFFLVMTIIPIVTLIISISASLSISIDTIRVAIDKSVPPVIANMLNSIMVGDGITFNLVVFYVSAILMASNGTYSMINISNEIYKVKPDDMIRRRFKAIVMILIVVGLILFLLAVPVFGTTLSDIIVEATDNNTIVLILQRMLSILKYPIIIIILYTNIKLVYIIAPDKEIPPRTTIRGSIFTAAGWVLSTEIFSFYLERFARYDLFYGSISNILVLLLWVYLLAYIFVLGMIINASIYKEELTEN
jgi:membrane protein